jgi:hypothetical protein
VSAGSLLAWLCSTHHMSTHQAKTTRMTTTSHRAPVSMGKAACRARPLARCAVSAEREQLVSSQSCARSLRPQRTAGQLLLPLLLLLLLFLLLLVTLCQCDLHFAGLVALLAAGCLLVLWENDVNATAGSLCCTPVAASSALDQTCVTGGRTSPSSASPERP